MTPEQQKNALVQMAKDEAARYNNYAEKPMYYLQVNKSACRLIVRVNDIPLGFPFIKDEGQSMLYPINDCIFSSGKQTFSIDVYPMSTDEYLTKEAHINVKLVYLSDKDLPLDSTQTLTELNLPLDIGTRELPFYTDSAIFTAKVPYDYSHVLDNMQDLTKIRNLEEKVVQRYKEIRQYIVNFDGVGYQKERALGFYGGDMNYLTEDDLIESVIYSLANYFDPDTDVVDRRVIKIENYEMLIVGNGKFVLLREKGTMQEVLRVRYFESEEKKAANQGTTNWMFITLCMPKGSDRLEMFY